MVFVTKYKPVKLLFGFYQEVEKNRIGIEGTSSKMR